MEYTKAIDRNVSDWYDNRINYATFTKRQRAIWNEIDEAGATDLVLDMIRPRLSLRFCHGREA